MKLTFFAIIDFFPEFFFDSKIDIYDPSPPTAHRNATALPPEKDPPPHVQGHFRPGIAETVTGRGSGSDYKLPATPRAGRRSAQRSVIRAVRGRVAGGVRSDQHFGQLLKLLHEAGNRLADP